MVCTGVNTNGGGGSEDLAPAAPNGLTATGNVTGNILNWNPNLEPDLAGYNVYWSASLGGTYVKLNGALLTTSSYVDTAAASGVATYYHVTAVDTAGHESTPAAANCIRPNPVITPPAAPTGLVATGTASGVQLTWNANAELDVVGYNVYYSTASGGTYVKLNTSLIATTGYADNAAPAHQVAYYKITAVNSSNLESTYSSIVSATPQDITPPAIPTGLVAVGGTTVVLTWNANTDSDLAGYNVYSSPSATGVFTKINVSLLVSPTYTDSTITAGQTLYYAVTALDTSNNESGKSSIVSASRPVGASSTLPLKYLGGEVPCLAIFSLWDTSVPNGHFARECMYAWNAGDGGSTYNIVQCRSPMFHHFYQNAGSYTVTCTRTDPNLNVVSYSTTIKVSASTRKKIYVDAVAGNDSAAGTLTAPLKTIDGILGLIGNNTEVLFSRGQVFTLTGQTNHQLPGGYSNLVYRDYGSASAAPPQLFIQMPTTSGPLVGNRPIFNFLIGSGASHMRVLNLTLTSNAVSGNYTSGGKTTDFIDPSLGHIHGSGVVFYNCGAGNLSGAFNCDGIPNFWLLQQCVQTSSTMENEFIWGEGTYCAVMGCVQVEVSGENGTRIADGGVTYAWLHDSVFGKTVRYKGSLTIRTAQKLAMTKCTVGGANFGFSPRENRRKVDNVVVDAVTLTRMADLQMSVGISNIDIHNLIIDQGTTKDKALNLNVDQGPPEPNFGGQGYTAQSGGMLFDNIRFFHTTLKLGSTGSDCIQFGIGNKRDLSGNIIGKDYPVGFEFHNGLASGSMIAKYGGHGINSNDAFGGVLTGIAAINGNCWPIINYDPIAHPASLGTDGTHVLSTSVTNTNFAKFAAVHNEHYQQTTLDSNYRPTGAPTSPLHPVSRYDYDGNLRTVTSGKVTVGAKQ